MSNSRDFVDHVLDFAGRAGSVSARAMFGGHGIYLDGLIVAIVIDDTLYLKSDARSRAVFDERQLVPFEYAAKDGERVTTSYRRAPDEALESPDTMQDWLRTAKGAALRATAARSAKRPRVRKAKAGTRA